MHRSGSPDGPPRRRRSLGFEGLEARQLLSAGHLPAIGPTPSPSFAGGTPLPHIAEGLLPTPTPGLLQQYASQIRSAGSASRATSAANSVPFATGYAIKNPAQYDGPPVLTNPTPGEVAREYFLAKFEGRYTVGPGRFAGQALTIHAGSTFEAGTNQFLKGKAQLILFTPSDVPAVPPWQTSVDLPGGRVTGLVSLFAQNYTQSGNLPIIDVGATNQSTGAPDLFGPTTLTSVGGLMLPTEMPWAFDNTSAGAYTAPVGFTQGGGRLSIRYVPDSHPRGGAMGSGRIVVLLQGLMNTSSILNGLDKGFN